MKIIPVVEDSAQAIEAVTLHERIVSDMATAGELVDGVRKNVAIMLDGDKWKQLRYMNDEGEIFPYRNAVDYIQRTFEVKEATAYDWKRVIFTEKAIAGLEGIGQISLRTLREVSYLAKTDEARRGIYLLAQTAVGGVPTSGDVKRTMDVLGEVLATGSFEPVEGVQVGLQDAYKGLTAAVRTEIDEALQRRITHITNSRRPRRTVWKGSLKDFGAELPDHIRPLAKDTEKVYVIVMEDEDEEPKLD